MTTETQWNNILDHAKSSASSLANSAERLARGAVNELDESVDLAGGGAGSFAPSDSGLSFPGMGEGQWAGMTLGAYPSGGQFGFQGFQSVLSMSSRGAYKKKSKKKPKLIIPSEFPSWMSFNNAKVKGLSELNNVAVSYNNPKPKLELGSVPAYTRVGTSGLKNDTKLSEIELPDVDEVPDFPDTDIPPFPVFLELHKLSNGKIEVPESSGLAPPPTLNDIPNETELDDLLDLYGNMVPGPAANDFSVKIGSVNQRAAKLASDRIKQAFVARYEDPLPGLIQKAISERFDTRNSELDARIDDVLSRLKDNGGWKLPNAVYAALEDDVRSQRRSWLEDSKSRLSALIEEYTLDFFENCGDQYAVLRQVLINLKGRETELSLDAFEASMYYSKTVCNLIINRSERELKLIGLEIQSAQSELDYAEIQLQLAIIEREFIAASIDIEKLRQENNSALLKTLGHSQDAQNTNVQIWTKRVKALRSFLMESKLEQATYEAKIGLFNSQLDTAEAQVDVRMSAIKSDTAIIDYRNRQVALYSKNQKLLYEEITAKQQLTKAQIGRNDMEVDQYTKEVEGALASLKPNTEENEYNLLAYRATLADFMTDAKLDLKKKQTQQEYDERETRGQEQAEELTREMLTSAEKVELDRMKGIADAIMVGSKNYAGMALKAISTANSVAGQYSQEF